MKLFMKKNAFTLIELSIVLVIISIIITAISVASTLVKSTETKMVIKEVSYYKAAIDNFKISFDTYPGDYNGAFNLWGAISGANCTNNDVNSVETGCNGNGNGSIDGGFVEDMRSWQHLSLGGFIPGKYPGINPANNTPSASDPVAGYNIPKGKLSNSAYHLDNFTVNSRNGNGIRIANAAKFSNAIISPADAYIIDAKIDDGLPTSGNFYATIGVDISATNACVITISGVINYNFQNNGKTCRIFIFFD
jgi:prepilin-type N-terminal cleavage/methylation domain-containing protein